MGIYMVYFVFVVSRDMWTSQVVLVVKNLPVSEGDIRDVSSMPAGGISSGRGHGDSLQYPCLKNAMDRGAWWAIDHRVAKSWTCLKQLRTYACTLYLKTLAVRLLEVSKI